MHCSRYLATKIRALDKREYLMIIQDNFFSFLNETVFCDPSSEQSREDNLDTIHCDPSSEPSHMRGHNICFHQS